MKNHNQIISDNIKSILASSVIYGGYVKTELLEQLVYNTYGNSSIENATSLDVFIDINSIIHPLYSENNRIVYNSITDISAGLINMCAHYRRFFRYKLGVETRFFLVNSLNNAPLYRKFVANYNETFSNKAATTAIRNVIDNNMNLLNVLCKYLPGIYYINTVDNYETSVVIAYLIEMLNSKAPNLVISKDSYPMQLTALYPYTSYLYPIKYRSEDKSFMLPINEKDGYKELFWTLYSRNRKFNINKVIDLDPINFALFLALYAYPDRDLNTLNNSVRSSAFIRKLVGSEKIKITPAMFKSDSELANNYPIAEIESRYYTTDITYALQFYRNSPDASTIKTNIVDLSDPAMVNNISAKYYSENPLLLQYL